MADVEVRAWSEVCFATYVDLGEVYPTFVGTEDTRADAEELGWEVLRKFGVKPLVSTVSGRVSAQSNDLTVGKSRLHNRIGRAGASNTRTPDLTSNTGRLPQ